MEDNECRSIGETLEFIKEEFPEVTISKIRFLETQGLIAPERTTNGYRKFYDHDIERLTFVLRQQREQFLPLKVIKDRITEKEPGVFVLDPSKGRFARGEKTRSSRFEKDIFGDPVDEGRHQAQHNRKVEVKGLVEGRPPTLRTGASKASVPDQHLVSTAETLGKTEPTSVSGAPANPSQSAKATAFLPQEDSSQASSRQGTTSPAKALGPPRRPRLFALPTSSALAEKLEDYRSVHESLDTDGPADEGLNRDGESEFPKNSFSAREIAEHASLTLVQVGELTTFGLLTPTSVRGQNLYSSADLELAVLAREFARFGLEARHLKMYKVSADREASFLEQVILPILAKKSQQSRNRAEAALTQLGDIGSRFRTQLLERAIEKILKS